MPRPKRVPAYQEVADSLRSAIVSGELEAGERLPPEADLEQEFGVSRSTIREAIRMLASQRLVTVTRGLTGGTRVDGPDHDEIAEMLHISILLLSRTEESSVDELLAVREILEVPAAELAAHNRTEEQLEMLRATVRDSEGVNNRGPNFEVDRTFHDYILLASGNRLLEALSVPVYRVSGTRFIRERAAGDFWELVHGDHGRILAAIEAQDAELAATEMRDHLRHLRRTWTQIDAHEVASSDEASDDSAQ
jgi:GntR family transcriptional repressor for pyruvate dehydrogenase complex